MRRVAAALDEVRSTRSKKKKVAALAGLLRALGEGELEVAARLINGELLPAADPRTLGVGWSLAVSAAVAAGGVDEARLGEATRTLGDFGDALASLWPDRPPTLTLAEVAAAVEGLAGTSDRGLKHRVLAGLFGRASAAEVRYLGKAVLGELRIGLQRGLFDEAVAEAFGRPLAEVRRASALTVDPGDLARLARDGRLGDATIVPGQVVGFMLASPIEVVKEPVDLALTVFEDKLDGVRTQAHLARGTVRLFARGQGEVTRSFPEVVRAVQAVDRDVIVDGEIIAVGPDGKVRPFQALQARLNRVKVTRALEAEVPVALVVYDCLYDSGSLIDLTWTERRAHLAALPLTVNPATPLDPAAPLEPQLDRAFTAARERGHEGLVLKRIDARYEAGRRGSAWRKVKRAFATLDVVITRAERGHGKRAHVLSDYTFAVWKGDELVDIGKAYSGLTDAEILDMTARLEALTEQRHGGLHVVRPHIVLEVAFDGLQPSTRHASGLAMRFPRILRIRDDKTPADADRLEDAVALWQAQVGSGHREAAPRAPQLSLFED